MEDGLGRRGWTGFEETFAWSLADGIQERKLMFKNLAAHQCAMYGTNNVKSKNNHFLVVLFID